MSSWLLKGEDNELVMTWPKGKQQMRLQLGDEQAGKAALNQLISTTTDKVSIGRIARPASGTRKLMPSCLGGCCD
jgi:hypothetical protein